MMNSLRRLAIVLAAGLLLTSIVNDTLAQGDLFGNKASAAAGQRPDVVVVSAQFAPTTAETGTLYVTAKIAKGWHIYSVTQKKGGPRPTKLVIPISDKFSIRGPIKSWPKPHVATEEVWKDLPIESHEQQVTFFAPLAFPPGADLKNLKIDGKLNAQACNEQGCLPPKDFPFSATLGEGVKLPKEAHEQDGAAAPNAAPPTSGGAPPAGAAPAKNPTASADLFGSQPFEIEGDSEIQNMSVGWAMLFGFAGGLLLNLMPCVLPVIGLKILSFVQQSGHSRTHVLMLNVWYSLGLLSVFLVLASLAVFAGFGWGKTSAFSEFNIAMAAVVFVMSLSFLGVWEIPIPGFVGGGAAHDLAAKEGPAGAFAKGAITTILATPCTGPFLSTALVWATSQSAAMVYAVFTSIGIGMASPYLLIGAFPQLVRWLPKPGAWMETFKQLMGFVLLGTVVYLLQLLSPPKLAPTVTLLFGLWFACWWIGRNQWSTRPGAKGFSWAVGGVVAAAIGIFAFTWLRGVTEFRFNQRVDEYAQQQLSEAKQVATTNADSEHLPWQGFSRKLLTELAQENKTVLVDFTADWCQTCKVLELSVLNTEAVRDLVRRNNVVTLKADWDADKPHYEDTDSMLKQLNGAQIPIVAIFPAGRPLKPIVLRGLYKQQKLLDALAKAGPSQSEDAASTAMSQSPAPR